jgi:hemerythrin
MKKIIWLPSYTVGDELLDGQHKKIIEMINGLIDHPDAEYTSETISDLLTSSTQYAVEHFKAEEEYMEAIRYPSLAVHRQEHKQFLVKITNATTLVMQKKQGPTDLLAYFKIWFVHHILYSDMKYRRYREEWTGAKTRSQED